MCEFVVAWRRVRPCARLWEHAYPAGDSLQSPSASRSFIKSIQLYAYPAGAYFCMRASSRALLHIGLLSLWDRQPSNAPPLLLSPAGLASRRGPHTKTHFRLRPKTPLPQIRSQGACGAFYVEIVDGEGSRGLGRGPPIGRGSSFADYKVFA